MANIDTQDIENQITALAKDLVQGFTEQAIADGKDFLNQSKAKLIKYADQLAAGEIDKDDFDDSVRNLMALAQMERLKDEGLAQVSIDEFTNGVVDILLKAGLSAAGV